MNKGLEIMETKWLFDIDAEMIDVVVHRQSIIHSMIEMEDGAVLAQMGPTDMRQPIQYAFGHPERFESAVGHLDFTSLGALTFIPPNLDKFPCLRHAKDAIREGGALPVVLNAANEAAVELFLERQIPFGEIERTVARAMNKFHASKVNTLLDIYNTDTQVKRYVMGDR